MKKIFIATGIILILASIFLVYEYKTRYRDTTMDNWERGKIVVGFKKDVDIEQAKKIIFKHNLKIIEDIINVPMLFAEKSGLIWVIEVSIGTEKKTKKKLRKEPEVSGTFPFYSIQEVIF